MKLGFVCHFVCVIWERWSSSASTNAAAAPSQNHVSQCDSGLKKAKKSQQLKILIMTSKLFFWAVFMLIAKVRSDASSMKCQSTKLVVYQVTFKTFWDREKFPKQYPEWRPPAQWSKLIGKTNNVIWIFAPKIEINLTLSTVGWTLFINVGWTLYLEKKIWTKTRTTFLARKIKF